MRKFLVLLALSLWGTSYGQLPELIYYQFNTSGSNVANHALYPVGYTPAVLKGNLNVATGGFLSSSALKGTGSVSSANNLQTGWNTRINGSFSLAFWVKDVPVSNRLNYVFGDKQAGEFRCFTNGVAGIGNWMVRGGQLPDLEIVGAASMAPRMIHIVYDSAAATYTSYVDGVQNTQVSVDSVPNVTGSGLVVGGYLDNHGLNGLLDEFRWYDRALDQSEISNTWNKDLNILGNCPPFMSFRLDTVTANAAQFSWVPGQGNVGYYLEYGPKGFNQGQGIKINQAYPAPSNYVISGLQPKTEYDVYFGEFCGANDSAYLPNPVPFSTTRLCPTPTQFQVLAAGTTSITLAWSNTASSANSHHVIYGFEGFNPALGGLTAVTNTNSYNVSGLSPATSYDIYLSADCGSSQGGSDTIGPLRVTTQCAAVTAYPFTEHFEPALPNAPGSLPQCWQISSANDLSWYINKGATPSAGTGPDVDHTTDTLTGHYMYLETSSSGSASYLYTPEFDLSQLAHPSLSFWYHMFGNSMGDLRLQVSVNSGQSWMTLTELKGEQHWGHSDPWKQVVIDISPFISTQTSFRFIGNKGGSFTGDMAIDDVVIESGSSCLPPAAFFLTATDSSANFRIIGGGNSYGIEWGASGFTPGTGCNSVVNSGIISVFNALDTNCISSFGPNKLMDAYIWNECDPSQKVKITFKTACSSYAAPYLMDFDLGNLMQVPDCWTAVLSGNSLNGGAAEVYDFGSPLSAPHHLRLYNGSGQSTGDTALIISPTFNDLQVGDKQISFSARGSVHGQNLVIGSWNALTQVFSPVDTVVLMTQYQQYVVSFSAQSTYNGTDAHIAMLHSQENSFTTAYIDDFEYDIEPACLPPLSSGFKLTDVSFNSAKLEWGAAGQGQLSTLEWGIPGFVPGAGQALSKASVSGLARSYVIYGLAPNTTYEVYLRDSCDFDKLSPWVGPVEFTTNCLPVSAPFTETFDGSAWQPGITSSEGDAISACWSREPSEDGRYKWGVYNATTASINTGPALDHSGSGNYLYTEASAGSANDTAWIYSPWVDISSLTRPAFGFYYHRFGNDLPDAQVELRGYHTGWDSVLVLNAATHNAEIESYLRATGRISSYGDTVQLRIRAVSKGCCAGDMAIDELSFYEAPSCPDITAFQAFGTSDSSGLASWDSLVDAMAYQVWIGRPGNFNNGLVQAGSTLITTSITQLFDTLRASECYEISVRPICAVGDTGTWANPIVFCSLCTPIAAPESQNFDLLNAGSAGDLGGCWTTSNPDGLSYGWIVHQGSTTSGNTGPLGDAGTGFGRYLYTEASVGAAGDQAVLSSSRLDVSALSAPELRFSYHMYGSDIDTLHIDVKDDSGLHQDVLRIEGPQHFFNTDPWSDTLVDLGAFSGTIQVFFRTYRGAGFKGDLALDNIVISDPVTCPTPTQLDTSMVTSNSADLTWSGGVSGTYEVAFGKAIASFSGASMYITNSNKLSVTGLDGGSQYGYFVRKICGPGDTSQWAGPFYFYTDCVPMVTAPYYANFEGVGAGSNAPFLNCWDVYSPQALRWESEVASGTDDNTVSTGPHFDNTVYPAPMGTYMFLESSLNGSYAELISPAINTSGIQNPELVYHFHMYGQDINKLEVYLESYINGSRFLVDSVVGQKQLVGSMPFWERRVGLSNIPLTSFKLVFKAYKGSSYKGDIAIDDVWIDEVGANTCFKPQSVAVNGIGCDSIALSWLSTSGLSVVEYGPHGFTAGSGMMVAAQNNQVVIGGLSPTTNYDIRLANICGTDTSDFTRLNKLSTLSAPVPQASITYTDSLFASKNHSAKYFTFSAAQSTDATSYYWDFGNGQTSTQEEVMTFFVFNKTYEVMLVAINGCGTDTTYVTVNVDIDIEETPLSRSLEIYPNPAKDIVNLEFKTMNDGKAIVRLSDVTGKEVMSFKEENINGRFSKQIDVSRLPGGIYLLEVDDGVYSSSRKLVRTY